MVDIDAVHKQERYLDESGKRDWIDECADSFSPTEFRGAMKFTIGKYLRRLGKKDPVAQEQAKIDDYINRWVAVEVGNHESFEMAEMYVKEEVEALKNGS